MQQDRYYKAGTALNRVYTEAAYYPRCSDDKTARLSLPRDLATKHPYMQVNRPGMESWLIFDLDHDNPWIWEEAGLPAPNLIVMNRNEGSSHLFYAIKPVCTSLRARAHPIRYKKAIYEAMARKLRADASYSGPVAKTPGHPWWSTTEIHNIEYSLGELADYVDLEEKPRWSRGPDIEGNSHSRHCLLFEEARYYAYSIVNELRDNGTFEHFHSMVQAFAENKNNFSKRGFPQDLTYSQMMATVKSISRWTWDNYHGTGRCHVGAMSLNKSLPLNERQSLAATRTHKERQKSTVSKIRAACANLRTQGKKLTYVAIARISKLTRQTVAKYKDFIEHNEPCKIISITEVMQKSKSVNYATYQIPPALSFSAFSEEHSDLLLFLRRVFEKEEPD
ncbi:replication initiation protein [Algicola sagamiensis]|uniref:replication initiation protein n=1 Tax=Algicola sagamiensis TaxID=163869 RepID=UPI000366F89C|nr:replication initiation protein [Algicola sagamiensis]